MKEEKCFENYPLWIVLASNLFSLATYAVGAYVIYQVGIVWLALYLLYILFLEARLMKNGCVNCYYYGKRCFSGRGKASSLLFKKGNPEEFCRSQITWKELLPDLLVSIIPILAGIALLIADFKPEILLSVVLLVVLATAGNWLVRGSLACNHCRQRELGCPAEKFFSKK